MKLIKYHGAREGAEERVGAHDHVDERVSPLGERPKISAGSRGLTRPGANN